MNRNKLALNECKLAASNALIEKTSDAVLAAMVEGVKGLKKADRISVTMCVLLNAISGAPDVPQALKEGLSGAFSPNCSDREVTDTAQRAMRLIERARNAGTASAEDEDFGALIKLADDLSMGLVCTILSHLDLLGWDESQQINEIVSMAIIHTLLMLDAKEEDKDQFGGTCKGMLQSLTELQKHMPIAA
jgi:hypothetical protein